MPGLFDLVVVESIKVCKMHAQFYNSQGVMIAGVLAHSPVPRALKHSLSNAQTAVSLKCLRTRPHQGH